MFDALLLLDVVQSHDLKSRSGATLRPNALEEI
jgi:hypothetical protein